MCVWLMKFFLLCICCFFFQLCTNWKKQNWEKPTWTWSGTTSVAVAQWCRTPLSTATISEVQFPRHIRETLQGQTCRCENRRTWGAGTPRTAPIPQQGRVEVAPGARTDSAPLDQPRRVEEGGGGDGGVSQSIQSSEPASQRWPEKQVAEGEGGREGGRQTSPNDEVQTDPVTNWWPVYQPLG